MLHAYYLESGISLEETKSKIKLARQMNQFFMLSDIQQQFLEQLAITNSENRLEVEHQKRIHPKGIDHVCLLVSDLEIARAYYH